MTKDPIWCEENCDLSEALEVMLGNHFRHLPVVKNGSPVGVLDVTKCLQDALKKLRKADLANKQLASALENLKELGSKAVVHASQVADTLKQKLGTKTINDLCLKRCPIVNSRASVLDACKLMKTEKQTAVLIMDDKLKGIFTTKDLVLRVLSANLPLTTSINRVMTPYPDTIGMDCSVLDALEMMHTRGYLHLPVVDSGFMALVDVLELTFVALEQLDGLEDRMWLEEDSLDSISIERRNSLSVNQSAIHQSIPMSPITESIATNSDSKIKIKSNSQSILISPPSSYSELVSIVKNRLSISLPIFSYHDYSGDTILLTEDDYDSVDKFNLVLQVQSGRSSRTWIYLSVGVALLSAFTFLKLRK